MQNFFRNLSYNCTITFNNGYLYKRSEGNRLLAYITVFCYVMLCYVNDFWIISVGSFFQAVKTHSIIYRLDRGLRMPYGLS